MEQKLSGKNTDGGKSDMQIEYIKINNLKISKDLLNFVNNELLKGTEILPENFWKGFDQAVHELASKNKELLKIRDELQKQITELEQGLRLGKNFSLLGKESNNG